MRAPVQFLIGLLLLPSALACSPPYEDPDVTDFETPRWVDGRVETNLRRDRIRLDLEDGTWEAAGSYRMPWGGGEAHVVTSPDGTIQLRYLMGDACCLCGPYQAGLELVVGDEQVQTWGPPYRGSQSDLWESAAFIWGNSTHGIVLDPDTDSMTVVPWASPDGRWTVSLGIGDALLRPTGDKAWITLHPLANGTLLFASDVEPRVRFLGLDGWVHDPLEFPVRTTANWIGRAWDTPTNATFWFSGWLAHLELGPAGPSWTRVTPVPHLLEVHRVAGGFLLRNSTHAWTLAGLGTPLSPLPLASGETPRSLLDVGEGRTAILTTVEKRAHRVILVGPDLSIERELSRDDWLDANQGWRLASAPSTGPAVSAGGTDEELPNPKNPGTQGQSASHPWIAAVLVTLGALLVKRRRA